MGEITLELRLRSRYKLKLTINGLVMGLNKSPLRFTQTTLTTLLEALENVQRFRPLAQIGLDD